VQTFLEKSDAFSNIPSSHDILEYEFRLTHLEIPLQVEKGLSLINIQKSWPLKGIVATVTSTPLYQTRQ
jgi:hypothetical protein